MGDGFDSVTQGLARVKCPTLVGCLKCSLCIDFVIIGFTDRLQCIFSQVLGVTTDILFPIQQQRDLVEMLKESGR